MFLPRHVMTPPPYHHHQTSPFLYSPTLSLPLHPIFTNSTPLPALPHSQQASTEFIQIFWHFASPHFPSRNDLWQLEMGSVGGASSDTLPSKPPSLFVERLFSFVFSSLLLYSLLLLLSAGEDLESSSFSFLFDSKVWSTNWVIFVYLLIFCICCLFVTSAQCPHTVWSCADIMFGNSEGNHPTTFVWTLWGHSATKSLHVSI